jgi:hypothetical protein
VREAYERSRQEPLILIPRQQLHLRRKEKRERILVNKLTK